LKSWGRGEGKTGRKGGATPQYHWALEGGGFEGVVVSQEATEPLKSLLKKKGEIRRLLEDSWSFN